MRANQLAGQRFGLLTAVEDVGSYRNRRMWRCICDCGNEIIVPSDRLRSGNTKSCGCQKYGGRKTHGDAGGANHRRSRLYGIWAAMKNRCRNPSHIHWENYGGKGVSVCDEWQTYEPFKEWALANGYEDGLSIDRVDVNGNYCPENCRWADQSEQMNNTTRNHLLSAFGQTHTIAQWADQVGIPEKTLQARVGALRWTPERALTQPVRGQKQ